MSSLRSISIVGLVCAALTLSSCAPSENAMESAWPEKLVFAGAPLQADIEAVETYKLMIEILETELGIPVEFYEATDRAAIVEALGAGRVDLANIDPFGYVLATGLSEDVSIIAASLRIGEDKPGFLSYGIARSDDDSINSLADVKGKRVCYSDPASTGGYLIPAVALKEAGIDPSADTSTDIEIIFTGIFPVQPAVNVANNDCDLGFVPDGQYERVLPATGLVEEGALKVIWKSEQIAGYALAMNTALPADFVARVTEIVNTKVNKTYMVETGLCASEQECAFSSPVNWGYVPEVDSSYEGIRGSCRVLGITQCQSRKP